MSTHLQGHVTMVEESQKKKKQSEANLYIVPFCRYNLNESMPMSMLKHMEDDVPPVFMILDTYDKDIKSLLPGTHLFCVYGDNWFQSVRYTLRCLVAAGPTGDSVERIRDSEKRLSEKKQHLETFQSEFCDIKKKFEEACKKLEQVSHFYLSKSRAVFSLLKKNSNPSLSDVSDLQTIAKHHENVIEYNYRYLITKVLNSNYKYSLKKVINYFGTQ